MKIPFEKYHGAGNDFVVIERRDVGALTESAAARLLCDRSRGVGADGLIVLSPGQNGIVMEFFNPDGTRDVCGNGMRVAALWRDRRESFETLPIEVDSGVVLVSKNVTPEGEILFRSAIPILSAPLALVAKVRDARVEGFLVDMGTPHFVVFPGGQSATIDDSFRELSVALEKHPSFPEPVSIDWIIAEEPEGISIRIWERSVGETLACGTGVASVALVAQERGRALPLSIQCKGGTLVAHEVVDNAVVIEGPAQFIYSGVFVAPEA